MINMFRLFIILILCSLTTISYAKDDKKPTINSAKVNNANSISVAPSDTVTISLSVTLGGKGKSAKWKSTGWRLVGSSGNLQCDKSVNEEGSGTYNHSFNVSAPSAAGSYNLYLVAYGDDKCNKDASAQLVLSNAVTVASVSNPSPPDTANCPILIDYEIYSSSSIKLSKSITVNGNKVSSGEYSPNASIDSNGTISTNASLILPDISPSSFPTNNSKNKLESNSNININASSAVYYEKVKLKKDNTSVTFTGSGPFHIKELTTDKERTVINFSAGTYFIDKLKLKKENTTINITSGPVYLHIGSEFKIENKDANINKTGLVKDLIVYLHSNAKFEAKKERLNFSGVIYGPDSGEVKFEKDVNFHGLITVGGKVSVSKEDFSLTLSESDKTALAASLSCQPPTEPEPSACPVGQEFKANGLQADYFNYDVTANSYQFPTSNSDLSQIDSSVDYNWGTNKPDALINENNFTARWEGYVKAPETGDYIFSTDSDDGVRLWIDDQLVIDNWTLHSATRDNSAVIKLVNNKHYKIRMEYFEHKVDAVARLLWQPPSSNSAQVIPSSALFTCGSPTPSSCSTLTVPDKSVLYSKSKLTFWSSIDVNNISVTNTGQYSPKAAVTASGQVLTNQEETLVGLSPAVFPSNSSSNNLNPSSDITYNSTTDISYGDITLNTSATSATFTGGGPFHIKTLKPNSPNTVVNLAAGSYYIDKLIMNGSASKINITSGPVFLHIGNELKLASNDLSINEGGKVQDLIVYLHDSAKLTANGSASKITAYIYGPKAGDITIGNNNIRLNGAVINGNGPITINSSGFKVNFSDADKSALKNIGCDAPPIEQLDHFEFSYAKNAISCEPSNIVVKACADSSCSSLYTKNVSISASPNNMIKTLLNGTETLQLNHSATGQITLSLDSSTITSTSPLRCYADNTVDNSCTINVADAGFKFDVLTLTSCKPSAEVTIRAIKAGENTNQCIAALAGTQSVNFWSTYSLPTTGTKTPFISTTTIGNSESRSTPINLEFDIDGNATFTAQYDDAGKIELNASYTSNDGVEISGSDEFISKPVALVTYSSNDNATCETNDASCSKFKKAGEEFALKVKAACWQEDGDTDLTNNPATPNFILNSIPTTHSLIAPAEGTVGNLSLASFDLASSDNGEKTISQSVSEVGVFTFSTIPPNYLDESLTAVTSPSIGRFYPDHFEVTTKSNGDFTNSCGTFTYSGQDLYYGAAPELTVSAFTKPTTALPASITQNYTSDFAKLTSTDFTVTTPTSDATQVGANGSAKVRLDWTPEAAVLTDNKNGSITFTFANDKYNYRHETNSVVGEFTNAVDLTFAAITDSDAVSTIDLPQVLQPSGANIRFGRIEIADNHGSELAPLSVDITAEYFNGFNWITNSADQCTTLNLSSDIRLKVTDGVWSKGTTGMPIGNGTTSVTIENNAPLSFGEARLNLSAPGEDNEGFIDIRSRISGLRQPWLLGDYDNDGNFDDEAIGRASFGLFKGSDAIIFRRELY